MFVIDTVIQMWAIFALILAALVSFARERWPLELTALAVIAALLVFFYVFPVPDADGRNQLAPARLLAGFASPALITVLALLVIGEGLKQTGVLDQAAQVVFAIGGNAGRSIAIVLFLVMVISAFLNNIPVVVMFIPIMQALAARVGRSASSVMIPLSFVAVLGGMGTLIGSSTNLLVSGEMGELGIKRLSASSIFRFRARFSPASGFFYALLDRAPPPARPRLDGTSEFDRGCGQTVHRPAHHPARGSKLDRGQRRRRLFQRAPRRHRAHDPSSGEQRQPAAVSTRKLRDRAGRRAGCRRHAHCVDGRTPARPGP